MHQYFSLFTERYSKYTYGNGVCTIHVNYIISLYALSILEQTETLDSLNVKFKMEEYREIQKQHDLYLRSMQVINLNIGFQQAFICAFFFAQTCPQSLPAKHQLNVSDDRPEKKIQRVFGLKLYIMADQQPADENLALAPLLSCLLGAIADNIFQFFVCFFPPLPLSLCAIPS